MARPSRLRTAQRQTLSRFEHVLVCILHQHGVPGLVLVVDKANIVLAVKNSAVRLILNGHEVQEQVVLDSASSVRRQVRVVPGVQLSRHADIVGVSNHAVDVSGAVRVAAHDLEERGRRAGGVNGVLGGLEAVKREVAVLVGSELASEVVAGLVFGVKDVILAVGACLPHVEDCAWNALAGLDINDLAVEDCLLSVLGHVLDHAAAKLAERCLRGPEGPENSRGCGGKAVGGDDLVVDLVNETVAIGSAFPRSWTSRSRFCIRCLSHTVAEGANGYSRFNAKDIAHSPCLIPVLFVGLAKRVDIIDTDNPFILLELDFSTEVVDMPDQGAEDFSVSRQGLGGHEFDDMLGEIGIKFAAAIVGSFGASRAVRRHDTWISFLS